MGIKGDEELRGVFVLDDVAGGATAGMVIPKAGEEIKFLVENFKEFKRKAEMGDQDFVGLIRELKEREIFKGIE